MLANRIQNLGTTIFTEMTQLANEYQSVNLGQGFPDFPAPEFLKEAGRRAITADINQYAPASGRLRLREAIAAKMGHHYQLKVDPHHEITITSGATEAIFAALLGLVNPGDEVILIEPYYDSYVPSIEFAGGVPRYYTLRPPHWEIDFDELGALFNAKTKAIVVNSPHNPTGKVFTTAELTAIAQLCQKHNVVAISDEVYEHITFDGVGHRPLATIPGMAERTVTISSLGKSFSATGWKVGWAIAPPPLTQAVFRTHQFITFSGTAPLQEAAADALIWADSSHYYQELQQMYQKKRDYLLDVLRQAQLPPITPQGTYFAMVDLTGLGFANDVEFCRQLTTNEGVTAIPPSAFYHDPHDGATLARFAFCKRDETLTAAADRLLRRRA